MNTFRRGTMIHTLDFRLRGIKGVEAGGSAPVSKEHGITQPLRALCLSLSRYRQNRLPLLIIVPQSPGLVGRTPAAVPAAALCSRSVS